MVGGVLLGFAVAHAQGADRVSVSLGLTGVGAPSTAGALGAAYLSVRMSEVLYVDVGGRMGLLGGPFREVTGVNVALRARVGEHLFGRAGFAHQHETPWADYVAEPISHTIGSGHGIGHRSGLDAGLGWQWTLPSVSTSGVHVSVAAIGTWFPDPNGPPVYLMGETLLTVDLGKKRAEPETGEEEG